MLNINKIINLTKNPDKFIEDGRSAGGAKKYNGWVIKTTIGITGIICGYKAQKDYWIYWVDTHTLTHYDHIQTSRITKGIKTDQISHLHNGTESFEVPKEERLGLLELAKDFSPTIARVMGPLELGDAQFRQVCNDVAERERTRKYEEAVAQVNVADAAQERYDRLVEAIEKLGLVVNEFTLNGKSYTMVVPACQ